MQLTEFRALLEREEGMEEAEGGKGQNALPFEAPAQQTSQTRSFFDRWP